MDCVFSSIFVSKQLSQAECKHSINLGVPSVAELNSCVQMTQRTEHHGLLFSVWPGAGDSGVAVSLSADVPAVDLEFAPPDESPVVAYSDAFFYKKNYIRIFTNRLILIEWPLCHYPAPCEYSDTYKTFSI